MLGGLAADAVHAHRHRREALIFVSSQPAGASIEVDGAPLDALTPHAVSGLAAGTHVIRVAKPGLRPVERAIDLIAMQHTELHVRLPP